MTFENIDTRIPPGFKLKHILRGHQAVITRMAWSPDGQTLASASKDHSIRLWDAESGAPRATLSDHSNWVWSVEWSPDGRLLGSGSEDHTIRLWDAETGQIHTTITGASGGSGDFGPVYDVSWAADGDRLIAATWNSRIQIWDSKKKELRDKSAANFVGINCVACSPDRQTLASGSFDHTIRLWDLQTEMQRLLLTGHTESVNCLAWSPDGRMLASSAGDKTVRIWNPETGKEISTLEGHTSDVTSVSFSGDGNFLASKSKDNTVRLWRCDSWQTVAILPEMASGDWPPGLAFNLKSPLLATLGEKDTAIRLWELDFEFLSNVKPVEDSVHYTTAKIALVGDSGVGKTGLGCLLAHGEFIEQSSTHGQQFWVINELGLIRPDGTECEAVLWDFAGQPDYRLIHALLLDTVDLALVLFDPTNRQEPLQGVEYWLKQLGHRRKGQPCRTILVGARVDRGVSTLATTEIEEFCQRNNITGGYVATSAATREGVPQLMVLMNSLIAWDEMTKTVTTATFKRIKEYVLTLKNSAERINVLLSFAELRGQLEQSHPGQQFSDDEITTATELLASHGYVTILRGSFDQERILLAPDLLINLASSFVLEARRNPRGLGVLDESAILNGKYRFPEIVGLGQSEQSFLLDAAIILFLEHNLCFRETLGAQTFLVFPSLINLKRPRVEDVETVEDVSYILTGAVENVYAALVVLLGYTNNFTLTHHWKNQAQYVLGPGEICGFRQIEEREGQIELVLYYGLNTPAESRLLFQLLFERFLKERDVAVKSYPPVICPRCSEHQERRGVIKRIQALKDSMFCGNCGHNIILPVFGHEALLPPHTRATLAQEQALTRIRTAFESALVRIKRFVGECEPPTRTPR